MLSKTVKKTCHEGQDVLYNTITRKVLPAEASDQELKEHCFLEGMESEAIDLFLNRNVGMMAFTIIPTWECNLRCTHCTVLNKLVKKDTRNDDQQKIAEFIRICGERYSTKRIRVDFVGGEPLLVTKQISDQINLLNKIGINMIYSITTNLATTLTNDVVDLLKLLDVITVSVDGTEVAHNEQRKSFNGTNPYQTTISNVKELIKLGFVKKMSIQSALKDEHINIVHKKEFYKQFLLLGLQEEQIKFACLHPTEKDPTPSNSFLGLLKKGQIVTNICCKFRNNNAIIDGDKVYSDYYSWELLGTIHEPDAIFQRKYNAAKRDLPVLHDETCKTCPVIGCCWGGCVNSREQFKTPSKYCDQKSLIDLVDSAARRGTLIKGHELK